MVRKARRPRGWLTTPQRLLERARSGEAEAISSLFERYWQPVRAYLLRQPNTSRGLAEDATQELFVGLLRRDAKRNDLGHLELRPEESFGAWLARCARSALSNERRREKKHRPLVADPKPGEPGWPVASPRHPPAEQRLLERRASEQQLTDIRLAENCARKVFALSAQEEARCHNMPPDRLLDLARALDLVERAFARLRPEYDEQLFEHLKTTLLEDWLEGDLRDSELCRRLGFGRTYVAHSRSEIRWQTLPEAMLALQKEQRSARGSQAGPTTKAASILDDLRAMADALG